MTLAFHSVLFRCLKHFADFIQLQHVVVIYFMTLYMNVHFIHIFYVFILLLQDKNKRDSDS